MKKEEILSNLCYHDKRNPDYDPGMDHLDKDVRQENSPCYCDNCFYGRTKLAEEILKLLG
jgi:hypothetical protein